MTLQVNWRPGSISPPYGYSTRPVGSTQSSEVASPPRVVSSYRASGTRQLVDVVQERVEQPQVGFDVAARHPDPDGEQELAVHTERGGLGAPGDVTGIHVDVGGDGSATWNGSTWMSMSVAAIRAAAIWLAIASNRSWVVIEVSTYASPHWFFNGASV